MKSTKKVLRCIITLLFVAGIVSALRFTSHQKNNNSDLNMETANQENQEIQENQDTQEAPAYPVMQPEN
jgi:predicted cobalt transporter CbtA